MGLVCGVKQGWWFLCIFFFLDCNVSNVKKEFATSVVGSMFAAAVNIVRGLFGNFWAYLSFVTASTFHTERRYPAVLDP